MSSLLGKFKENPTIFQLPYLMSKSNRFSAVQANLNWWNLAFLFKNKPLFKFVWWTTWSMRINIHFRCAKKPMIMLCLSMIRNNYFCMIWKPKLKRSKATIRALEIKMPATRLMNSTSRTKYKVSFVFKLEFLLW